MALAGALGMAQPAISYAQNTQDVPTRIDNIWEGQDHQPTRAGVASLERQADIAPLDPQQLNQQLEQLNHRLLSAMCLNVPTDIASATGRVSPTNDRQPVLNGKACPPLDATTD